MSARHLEVLLRHVRRMRLVVALALLAVPTLRRTRRGSARDKVPRSPGVLENPGGDDWASQHGPSVPEGWGGLLTEKDPGEVWGDLAREGCPGPGTVPFRASRGGYLR